MKPQPLDLKKIKEIISDDECNPHIRNHYWIPEIKQRIKSACEFYLKYKDNPELLIKEHPEYREKVDKLWYDCKNRRPTIHSAKEEFMKIYSEWLFKLAFKSILDEKNETKNS